MRSFHNWLQAFAIYASVLGGKHHKYCSGLFQHMEHVLEAYKSFGGPGWFQYDKSFRQKLSIYPSLNGVIKMLGCGLI